MSEEKEKPLPRPRQRVILTVCSGPRSEGCIIGIREDYYYLVVFRDGHYRELALNQLQGKPYELREIFAEDEMDHFWRVWEGVGEIRSRWLSAVFEVRYSHEVGSHNGC